jgi:GxxExxY protein
MVSLLLILHLDLESHDRTPSDIFVSSCLRGSIFCPAHLSMSKLAPMSYGETTDPETERVASLIIDSIWTVYDPLGPGLLESVYLICLQHELQKRGLDVRKEAPVPIVYDGVEIDAAFRIDLLVNDVVIVELKAVEKLIPLFEAQLLTYLKLTNKRLGILVNFNARLLKDQLKRLIN